MSSDPTDPKADRRPGLLHRINSRIDRQIGGRHRPTRLIKRILPRGLLGRSILILVTPLILVQIVTTLVFYDRLWDTVVRRLSEGVAGDIAAYVDMRRLIPAGQEPVLIELFQSDTVMGFTVTPGATLPATPPQSTGSLIEDHLATALNERVGRAYQIDDSGDRLVEVAVQLPDGLLTVDVPRSRLFTGLTYVFIFWMVGTALVTSLLAAAFLRNQVRSLRRLAFAADAFGKGRDVPNFKPEGAAEVRQAAAAFLIMRERLHRQISQRTEMLAGVSHDLRTPLTRMKLELELLPEGSEIEGLKSDIDEMQQMIEGYLAFARGEGDEVPRPVDLMELLRDAVATARRHGLEVAVAGPESLDMELRRDALRRCVMNLLANAKRYGGHVWLTVVAYRASVEIMIDDDGPGIPEEMREAVFRPFYRLESSRNRETGGVGLGLAIARDIMRSHGGDLTLEASPQAGLRARMRLPR